MQLFFINTRTDAACDIFITQHKRPHPSFSRHSCSSQLDSIIADRTSRIWRGLQVRVGNIAAECTTYPLKFANILFAPHDLSPSGANSKALLRLATPLSLLYAHSVSDNLPETVCLTVQQVIKSYENLHLFHLYLSDNHQY